MSIVRLGAKAIDTADPILGQVLSSTDGVVLGRRNLLINGGMRVHQRGGTITLSSTGLAYTLDRMSFYKNHAGTNTVEQSTDTPVGLGFTNSLKFTTTTADSSVAATDRVAMIYRMEGYDAASLEFGTANAKTITISFYVKSSITGTHGGAVGNGSDNRAYPFTYTISSADTWERKSITIAGDTTGTWATNNTRSLQIAWGLGVGSQFSGTAGAWEAADRNSATGATTGVLTTVNATWFITGIQLEVGSSASDFEHRPFAEELNLCYRYFYKIIRTDAYGEFLVIRTYSSTQGTGVMILPVPMRVQPTFTSSSVSGNFSYSMSVLGFSTTDSGNASTSHRLATHNAVGAFTSGGAAVIQKANNADPIFMQYDAEL